MQLRIELPGIDSDAPRKATLEQKAGPFVFPVFGIHTGSLFDRHLQYLRSH